MDMFMVCYCVVLLCVDVFCIVGLHKLREVHTDVVSK